MRPERVRRIQAPFTVPGPVRVPRAANDNVPAFRGGVARGVLGRSFVVAALAAVLVLALGWLGRSGQAL